MDTDLDKKQTEYLTNEVAMEDGVDIQPASDVCLRAGEPQGDGSNRLDMGNDLSILLNLNAALSEIDDDGIPLTRHDVIILFTLFPYLNVFRVFSIQVYCFMVFN